MYPVKDIVSEITGKTYNPTECVYIKNPVQTGKYLKEHRVDLLDLIVGDDDKLVFVFDRDASRKYYTLWLNHQLD